MIVTNPLDSFVIPHGSYKCIVADPTWRYGKCGKGSDKYVLSGKPQNVDDPIPYPTMTVEEIAAMRVKDLAADDCDSTYGQLVNIYQVRLK